MRGKAWLAGGWCGCRIARRLRCLWGYERNREERNGKGIKRYDGGTRRRRIFSQIKTLR